MSDAPPPFSRRTTQVALLVAGAFFMENLDGTVIATALPRMATSFGTTPEALAIGMTSYLLTLAVVIPASGWMAERFGARRVFVGAIALFTAASVACALSQNVWSFTAARILQGCGGALMTPVGRLVVLRGTAKRDLMRAIATLTWPALTAPVLGPPLGDFITGVASWRWIFLINVPIGLAGIGLALRLLDPEPAEAPTPFDALGFLLNGAALGLLLVALDRFGQPGADPWSAGALLAASLGLGGLALRHARRHRHPLVGLGAVAVPTFKVTLTAGLLSRITISTLPFLLPLLFQVGLGLDPFRAGLLVLWYGLANIAIKPWTSPLLRGFGFRTVLVGNTLLNAAAIGACALIGPATPLWATVPILLVAGASRSMQFTAVNTLGFADMPQALTPAANTLFNMTFQLAVGIGIAAGAILLRLAGLLPGADRPALPFHLVFLVVGAVAALPALTFWRLPREAGAAVSGHTALNGAVGRHRQPASRKVPESRPVEPQRQRHRVTHLVPDDETE